MHHSSDYPTQTIETLQRPPINVNHDNVDENRQINIIQPYNPPIIPYANNATGDEASSLLGKESGNILVPSDLRKHQQENRNEIFLGNKNSVEENLSFKPIKLKNNIRKSSTLLSDQHANRKHHKKHKIKLKYCLLSTLLLLALTALGLLIYALLNRKQLNQAIQKMNKWQEVCYTPDCIKVAAILMEGMDVQADPCDDFYQFACGSWNRYHIIPEDRSSISTFEVLSSKLQILLKELLEEPINATDLIAVNKAKLLYQSCLNASENAEEPIRETLKSMGGWPILNETWNPASNFSIEVLLAQLISYNTPAYMEIMVGPDDKNSSMNILQVDQNSFVLPSREYYLNSEETLIIRAYKRLVYAVVLLMGGGGPRAQQEADEIVDLETEIALASVPNADRHDASAFYLKMKIQQLKQIVPQFDWMKFFKNIPGTSKISEHEQIVVYSERFLVFMGKLFSTTPRRKLVNYALWRHVNSFIPYMSKGYLEALFEFRKVIFGVSAPVIKWQQCVDYVNEHLEMPVGTMFVRQHFKNNSKESAMEMIHDIRDAFNELLESNSWMDSNTRKVAEEKANAMSELIGYPEYIFNDTELLKEYEGINPNQDFLDNVIAINKYQVVKNYRDLHRPVDRDRWSTGPAVVNAFYSPNKNNIVIPAGILQPLFYSDTFPKSLNYGGIGVVIGHEITHGFDEKGRQFDKDGNLKQWWNNSTISAFRTQAKCIIEQYSKYKLKEIDLYINGRNTQGENIADNGGLKQAFRAYQKWVKKHGSEKLIPSLNLTHNQLFFLNYAQIWCGSMRPEEALNKIHSSVHSPGPIRVIGPLSNSIDFSNAYNCPIGSKMNPVKKCNVW